MTSFYFVNGTLVKIRLLSHRNSCKGYNTLVVTEIKLFTHFGFESHLKFRKVLNGNQIGRSEEVDKEEDEGS